MNYFDNPNFFVDNKHYKLKFICTNCRKVYKRRNLSDITNDTEVQEKVPRCPDCRKIISWIGPKFRAPKTTDLEAWNSISILYEIGILKFIGWANDEIIIPKSKKGLRDYLLKLKNQFEVDLKKLLRAEYNSINKDQIGICKEAIKKIELHIKEIK